jgi:hypothetical protein
MKGWRFAALSKPIDPDRLFSLLRVWLSKE